MAGSRLCNQSVGNPGWRGPTSAVGQFPSPFCDMSSLYIPDTIEEAHGWCEYIAMSNGVYRAAISRVVSYFITDVEIKAKGDDKTLGKEEENKYKDFLYNTLGIKSVLQDIALDYLVYGNSITSLIMPFRRYLMCKNCGTEAPIRKLAKSQKFKYKWSNFKFYAHCPTCGVEGEWKRIDRRSGDTGKIQVKRWSVHEIDIINDPYTDDNAYVWKIPSTYKNIIRKGSLHHLERANWEIVNAIEADQDFMFDEESIYHMKEGALCGLKNRGWGFSRVLANFRQAWYVQVLHRYNESIALDYIMPMRLLTPQARSGGSSESADPILSINMGSFTNRVQQMIKRHRKDPMGWNILPFPVEYQTLGGDATQLAPKDLLELGMDSLLSAIGVPREFYAAQLSTQSAPAAMRLFEAYWSNLVYSLNQFLAHTIERVAMYMGWEPVEAKLQRTTHADDLNKQMAYLQLMMGGQISRTTGLGSLDLDFVEEERKKLEEERQSAEATARMQQEMQQMEEMDAMAAPAAPAAAPPAGPPAAGPAAGGQLPMMQGMTGAMPGGGAPAVDPAAAAAGGMVPGQMPASTQFASDQPILQQMPATPEEWEIMAEQLAQQAMGMQETQRKQFFAKLKKENTVMHSLVTAKVEDIRQNAQQQGGQMVLDQQFGGGM